MFDHSRRRSDVWCSTKVFKAPLKFFPKIEKPWAGENDDEGAKESGRRRGLNFSPLRIHTPQWHLICKDLLEYYVRSYEKFEFKQARYTDQTFVIRQYKLQFLQ